MSVLNVSISFIDQKAQQQTLGPCFVMGQSNLQVFVSASTIGRLPGAQALWKRLLVLSLSHFHTMANEVQVASHFSPVGLVQDICFK